MFSESNSDSAQPVKEDAVIVGIDEAGRGAMAGPVVVAAVILNDLEYIDGLKDSKKLTPSRRAKLYEEILEKAHSVGVSVISAEEVDTFNVLQATLHGAEDAFKQASTWLYPTVQEVSESNPKHKPVVPVKAVMDGNVPVDITCREVESVAIVKADDTVPAVMAASIVAKHTRDELMKALEKEHLEFKFSDHKGYVTEAHIEELKKFGPIEGVHRFSYAPVLKVLGHEKVADILEYGDTDESNPS